MSALGALFSKGGLNYRPTPDVIDLLPKELRHAASAVYRALMRILKRGQLDERATDAEISQECGWSESFVQRGLHALDRDLEAIGQPPAIERRSGIGCHGRRTIIPAPLAGSREPGDTIQPPPQTPPPDRVDTSTEPRSTTTIVPDPKDPGTAALIDRAVALIPKATPGRVLDVLALYPAAWLEQLLDHIVARNAKPGNKPVRSWGFVLTTLGDWRRVGGPPPVDPPPPTQAPPATRRTAATADPAETEREAKLRAKWASIGDDHRAEIRAAVEAAHPQLRHLPGVLEPLYLAELERRE